MLKKFILFFALLPTVALAQQQQSTALDRVSVSLGQCVGKIEQMNDQMFALQKQLTAAEARIKELAKPEQKKN